MKRNKYFEADYQLVSSRFPKLKDYFWSEELKCWIIEGELDICDTVGDYWDTFEIRIEVPYTYPNCVPIVLEVSKKIPREEDRHIDKKGVCCLDIEHKLLSMSKRGIRLDDFIANKVYPYFANQVYFESKGYYSSEEYAHNFAGIYQFYKEELKISSIEEAILILDYILTDKKLGRNDPCFCGKNKYKKCHLETVVFLNSVGIEQLRRDLSNFQKAN